MSGTGYTETSPEYPPAENWKCPGCANYRSVGGCKKRVFIAYVGCDTSQCNHFQEGVKCQHCGKVTPLPDPPVVNGAV